MIAAMALEDSPKHVFYAGSADACRLYSLMLPCRWVDFNIAVRGTLSRTAFPSSVRIL
ncbi:hypothetical protein HBH56_146250 [Parastagonospora nodorum]|uniref:Uncharacterized protein n=1 Tax=Phaeosphaeria nodorum (strain SN15 / ATCC MYA-4574 / FGSC 10173) TaxID=321614 RepID=A0A7U2FA90_PHANO|nr:hypothetical protein HBH56_146250 [Parastagonospora nodorum]QRD01273.1 hypothetical protein JI435_416360 [Parastagonospora nodorum SN15]KAH3927526.1 hypothetical protein HBH54_151440 [Parastagonospora nodorum]KAH4031243.1 hypothetical protein HBI09_122180 [Parastagonospora nodorum]KAH4047830.1 hypothetical protein HBH49_160830 [Parastagonospora nodorum]